MKKLIPLIMAIVLGAAPVSADDCLVVDLDVAPQLVPGEVYNFYAELTNCGDEAGIIYLDIKVDYMVGTFEATGLPVFMGAGESFSRTVPFMLPDCAPSGDASICVTAHMGEIEASDCVEFTIFNPGWGFSTKAADERDKDSEDIGSDF